MALLKKFSPTIIFSFIIYLVMPSSVFAADPELVGGSPVTATNGVAAPIIDLQLSGTGNPTVPVKLRVTSGTLSMSTTTGLTFTGSSTGSTLQFSGTMSNINAALATLTYTRSGTGSDTLEASLVNPGEVFFEDTGHLYEYVSYTATWNNANTNAQTRTKYGATGYLTTITSQAENDFVAARLLNAGWMGASDIAFEGDWKWVTGPENGTSFWSGASGGSSVSGRYANWGTGEPNNSGDEDCGQFLAGGSGKWNDLPCNTTTLPGYVVEYGSPGSPIDVSSKNITITTVNAPTVSTLSPTDGATGVTLNANLSITFSATVSKGTGDILIKKSSDNTTVETIEVSGSNITGGGTSTITINPEMTFAESTGYYINIPSTAFRNSSDVYYAGISNTTSWNFTTGDFTDPEVSDINTSSIGNTSATVVWTTNENTSSRVKYGLTDAYGTTTTEINTSPRVTSHAVLLSGLLACTTYHYAVMSTDASSRMTTSADKTFTTTGCPESTQPTETISTSIPAASGGTTSLNKNNTEITVSAPNNFTDDATNVVIQVKAMDNTSILSSLGRPTQVPNEVGSVVFDVKAIINDTTVLDSFDAPVTITYQYSDSDVQGLDESTFWLYHYHNGSWNPLDQCSINTSTNTISCTTQSFSIFGLFGKKVYASSPAATTTPICSAVKPEHTPDLFQIDVNKTQATLHFTPLSSGVTNYFVAYGYQSGEERFGVLTDQGASSGVLSYTIQDLSPNTTYHFKIRPQNDCMPGNWGNSMAVKTTNGQKISFYKNFVSRITSVFPRSMTKISPAQPSKKLAACEYQVIPGDSLWNIAQKRLGSGKEYTKIQQENNLSSANISVGQVLKIACQR